MHICVANRKIEAGPGAIALSMDLRRDLACFETEYSFLGEYEGELLDVESRAVAGRVRLFVVDLEGAQDIGWGALDLLDLDGATEPYIALLGEAAGEFSPEVRRLIGEEFTVNTNMLIIDWVELLPAYRRHGLGLACMNACLRHMSRGCRIAAIKPYPLQFEAGIEETSNWTAGLELRSLSRNQRTSLQRLKKHYGQLGFHHVRGTDLMILNLDG